MASARQGGSSGLNEEMDQPRQRRRRSLRTQAERSDTTRSSLLEAAIKCLHEQGYTATTTQLVAKEAGVSRGRMLHQFPTKVDLMLFVVRAVFDSERPEYKARMAAIKEPREQFLSLAEIVWEVLSRPSGVAVLEIFLGARSDPELAAQLRPLQSKIETESFEFAAYYRPLFNRPISPPLLRLIVWSVRGLSIAQMMGSDEADLRESVKLLRVLIETVLDGEPPARTLNAHDQAG